MSVLFGFSAAIMSINICVCICKNKRFAELAPHRGGETAGIDMIRENYVNVSRCIGPTNHYNYSAAKMVSE